MRDDQIARLDKTRHRHPIYPFWQPIDLAERSPKPTEWYLEHQGLRGPPL